jgi:hypothetical protein
MSVGKGRRGYEFTEILSRSGRWELLGFERLVKTSLTVDVFKLRGASALIKLAWCFHSSTASTMMINGCG